MLRNITSEETQTGLKLSWSAPTTVAPITGYQVYISAKGAPSTGTDTSAYTLVDGIGGTDATFAYITGLDVESKYRFSVVATNAAGYRVLAFRVWRETLPPPLYPPGGQ